DLSKYRNLIDENYKDFSREALQYRPTPDPEIKTRYDNILKNIMELLDVSESEAKTYRYMLILHLEETNPELKGYINNALKIKEIENIIVDKKTFSNYWNKKVKPELEKLKKIADERKALSEEKKKSRRKKFRKRDKKGGRDLSSDDSDS